MTCAICHEPITSPDGIRNWTHKHGDVSCGCGDGSVATPSYDE